MSATARMTGWAAIGYAFVYVLNFITIILVATQRPASATRYSTPEQMVNDRLLGDVGALVFALMGTALIVVAMGLRRLIWGDDSIGGAAASSAGVIAGAGLMLAGAAIAAQRGYAPNDLAGTGADAATQLAIVQAGSLLVNAGTHLARTRLRRASPIPRLGRHERNGTRAQLLSAVRPAKRGDESGDPLVAT